MKEKSRVLWILCVMMFMLALPVHAQAASSSIKVSGATKPTTLKQGSFFNMKGTITSAKSLKEVRFTIYDSTGKKCLQRYTVSTSAKTYNIANADPYLIFDKLAIGTYYYRVRAYDTSGYSKRVINKRFTVIGNGTIKITNPVPSSSFSISAGSSYSIGGTIKSTYILKRVTARILDSSGKTVYSKSVKPNKTTYTVANSKLDSAMLFENLTAGSYKFRLSATDSQGTTVKLIVRTFKVTGTSGTSPSATGGSTTLSSTYLNTSAAVTVPSGYVKRTTRPASTNQYYYNKTYNIYYGYNSLAPTGKVMSDGVSYVTGNCTWYACGRAMEIVAAAGGDVSKVQAIFGGDPVGIYNMNIKLKKFSYGTTPKIGALAVFNYGSGGDAHIAVVEDIINGVPYVSESGYSISTKKPTAGSIIFKYQSIYNWAGGRALKGYIYLI